MRRGEIFDQIRKILQREFALDEQLVVPDARLQEDLDLDSLDAVVLAIQLEEATGLIVEEDRLKEIRTVKEIADLVEELFEREQAHIARS
ncbi:MAG TPA: acyl carrier protein [Myxococcota bacterium]|nr:acyl carrier protein [Myxococcota bacterium]